MGVVLPDEDDDDAWVPMKTEPEIPHWMSFLFVTIVVVALIVVFMVLPILFGDR